MNRRRISIIELARDSFVAKGEAALTNEPNGPKMAVSHGFGFLVHYSPESPGAELCEIDLRTPYRIARSLPLPEGKFQGIAVHWPSCRVFVSDLANRTIWVVNRTYFAIQGAIPLGGGAPAGLAMSSSAETLYALSGDEDSLWVIDPNRNRVLGQLRNLKKGLAVAEPISDGSHIFVSQHRRDGEVCITRVLARPAASPTRRVFAVDRKGNCRISPSLPVATAAA